MVRRVRMVMVPLVLVLVACFGMRPALADWNDGGAWNVDDADMGVKWGPTSVGSDRKGFVMVSDNRYNACLILCGISINDERLTADAKAKLSNSDTGGGFYLLAQRFGQYGDGNLPDWAKPSLDMGSITANSAIRTCAAMYGADATWWGDYTELERTNALSDLLTVLNGGDLGGGSGGGSGGGQTSSFESFKNLPLPFLVGTVWNNRKCFASVGKSAAASVNKKLSSYPYVAFGVKTWPNNGNVNLLALEDIFVMCDVPFTLKVLNDVLYIETGGVTGHYIKDEFGDADWDDNKIWVKASSFSFSKPVSFTGSASLGKCRSFYGYGNDYLVSEPVIPPTQWPDSPTYEPPTEPVVPDPVEPTVPSEPSAPTPVEPVQPDPSSPEQNPVYIDQPTYVDNTYTADLQGILDALNEHCLHLQNALYANISDLYNKLSMKLTNDLTNLKSFLHGEYGWLNDARHDDSVTTWDYLQDLFSWLGGLISDNFYSLNQHLTQLFSWLAEQFDFSFTGTGYNDDTVVSWLKKIYSKLGTGMNTRPSDPVAEPDSFGDWLTRLLQNFIGDLLSVGQEAVGGLVNDFQQLATKFPFCVPWDIAALLALFVAEPVAPVFDLPAYTITQDGLSQVSTYHISLADYNVAWEAVRFAEKVGFAVFLAWNTTHFREFLSGRGDS